MKKFSVLLVLVSLLFVYGCSSQDFSERKQQDSSQAESVISEPIDNSTEINDNFVAGYIDFIGSAYGPFQGEGGYKYPERFRNGYIEFIESYDDYLSFCDETEFKPGEEFSKEFFDDSSVIFVFFVDGSTTPEYQLKNIYADENRNVTIKIRYLTYGGGDCALQTTTLAAKVKKSNLNNIASIKCEHEQVYSNGDFDYSEEEKSGKPLEFVTKIFDGKIENNNGLSTTGNPTKVHCPEIAQTYYDFSEIISRYTTNSKDSEFSDYTAGIDEAFFEKNILMFYSYSCVYDGCYVNINDVISHDEALIIDMEINNQGAKVFEDSEKIIAIEIPKQDWPDTMLFSTYYKLYGYEYEGELGKIKHTSRVFKIDFDTKYANNTALEDLEYSESMNAALSKDEMMFIITTNYSVKEPFSDELKEYLDQFDDEFFKSNALLISERIFVDKGERVEVTSVYRDKMKYLTQKEILLQITIHDSVKPSTNDDLDCYICFAIIDKNEMVGMFTSADVKLK